jgi:type I restriction enzyme S subunit
MRPKSKKSAKVEAASRRLSEGWARSLNAPSLTANASQMVELGKVISVSTEKTEPTEHSKMPYIGLEHIDRDLGTISGQGTASDVRSTKSVFRKGDLLYGKLRPYLNKVWMAQFDGVCSTDILVYPKSDSVDNAFLKYRFMSSDFVRYASENSNGVNLPRVNAKALAKFSIWLPSLSDQRRIVAEIEKQFTHLDAGVKALKRVQANLKRYRAAVLKAACEGRLVPTEAALHKSGSGVPPLVSKLTPQTKRQDAASTLETGEQLLARILREREKNWQGRGKYKSPAGPAATNLSPIPEGWTWATAQQLNIADRPCAYGVLQPGSDFPNGIPLVRVGDINNGKVDTTNLKRIAPEIAARYPRTKLAGGELAITLVGAIGRTAIIPDCIAGGNTARAVGIIPLTKLINVYWCEVWFRNPKKIAEMDSKSHEVARKTLNLEDVRVTLIALPPLAEQTRIVAEVERHLSVIAELESVVVANLKHTARLRQSILQQSFCGGLKS